jgi:hypothetical protein
MIMMMLAMVAYVAARGRALLLSGRDPSRSGRFSRVSLDVLAEVVTSHKALVTNRASKSLLPSVGPEVPG